MAELHTATESSSALVPDMVSAREPSVANAREMLRSFIGWLDAFGPLSQDPYDLWASGLGAAAKRIYYRHRLLGTIAAAPFVALDLVAPRSRSLVRRPTRSPIADAHYATGFFELARADADASYIDRGRAYLAALEESRSPLYEDPAWGYPFDWPSRYGTFRAGWPLITSVPYGYEAFEAGHALTGDPHYVAVMEGVARFAADEIPVTQTGAEAEAAAYSPFDRRQVVNASAYRGYLLTAAGNRFARDDWLEAGRRNVAFVLRSQQDDGSWPYSMDGADDFVDNFHTCFVLKNLAKVRRITRAEDVRDALVAGYDFYRAHLLDDTGLPCPFARRPRLTLHRRDLYDYAEGITLAALLEDEIPVASRVLERLVGDLHQRWALDDGHFATRELVIGRNIVPYHRWAQSQTFHALARVVASAR